MAQTRWMWVSHPLVKQLQVVLLFLILPPYLSGLFQFMSILVLYQTSRNKKSRKRTKTGLYVATWQVPVYYYSIMSGWAWVSSVCKIKAWYGLFHAVSISTQVFQPSEAVIRRDSWSISTLCICVDNLSCLQKRCLQRTAKIHLLGSVPFEWTSRRGASLACIVT